MTHEEMPAVGAFRPPIYLFGSRRRKYAAQGDFIVGMLIGLLLGCLQVTLSHLIPTWQSVFYTFGLSLLVIAVCTEQMGDTESQLWRVLQIRIW